MTEKETVIGKEPDGDEVIVRPGVNRHSKLGAKGAKHRKHAIPPQFLKYDEARAKGKTQ